MTGLAGRGDVEHVPWLEQIGAVEDLAGNDRGHGVEQHLASQERPRQRGMIDGRRRGDEIDLPDPAEDRLQIARAVTSVLNTRMLCLDFGDCRGDKAKQLVIGQEEIDVAAVAVVNLQH